MLCAPSLLCGVDGLHTPITLATIGRANLRLADAGRNRMLAGIHSSHPSHRAGERPGETRWKRPTKGHRVGTMLTVFLVGVKGPGPQ